MSKTELFIFDCDGVLVDTEIEGCTVLADYLASLGMPITVDECVERYCGLAATTIRDRVAETGTDVPATFAEDIRERTLAILSCGVSPCVGVEAALRKLNAARCVASSGLPKKIRQSMRLSGLGVYFGEKLFSATEVERGKPAPDLFLHACERMGVAPEKALVIEDSVAGVEAARAARIEVVGFVGGSHCRPGHAERLLDAGAMTVIDNMELLQDAATAA